MKGLFGRWNRDVYRELSREANGSFKKVRQALIDVAKVRRDEEAGNSFSRRRDVPLDLQAVKKHIRDMNASEASKSAA